MSATIIRFPASRPQPSREERIRDEIRRLFAEATPKPKVQAGKQESLIMRLERVVDRLEQLATGE